MAEKLSVQIALEGGEEIERQLADIGKAGQQAFVQIGRSAEQVGGFRNIKPEQVTAKLKELGVTGVESINKIQAAVRSAGRLEGLVQGINAAQVAFAGLARAAGVVGVAAAAGFVALSKATFKFATDVNKASTEALKLGLSIEKFDQLRIGLEAAGISAGGINSGLTTLKQNLEKLDVTALKAIADNLQKLKDAGVRFAPGAAPGLQQLIDAAKGIGPAAEVARQALVNLGLAVPPKEKFDAVSDAFQRLGIATGTVDQRLPEIIAKLQQMPDGAERTQTAITLLGEKLGVELIQALRTGGVEVDQFKSKLGLLTTDQENAANALEQSINRMEAAWARFGSVAIAPQLTTGINSITAAIQALQQLMAGFSWEAFGNAGVAAFNLITNAATAFTLQGMLSWIARAVVAWTGLIDVVKRAMGAMSSGAGGPSLSDTGNVGGFAGGGLLGGRGTGTSDSNLAWLSRGEYVIPAHAVRQPGVLAMLEALRRSGGNLSRVLDGMGRFALGGMVPHRMGIPAFANGGPVGSMSNVTIQFPGVPPVGGLRASSEVVDQLHKAAALAQVRSGGRKPSRYS